MGFFGGLRFLPPFDHPHHLKSGVPPCPPPPPPPHLVPKEHALLSERIEVVVYTARQY